MADGAAGAGRRPAGTTRVGAGNVDRILDAGLSKTNLLYYFPSKDALYEAVLTRTLDTWLEPLRGLDAAAEPAEALASYIGQKLDQSRRQPLASRLYAMEMMQGAPVLHRVLATELAGLVAEKSAILRGWMADGRLAPAEPAHLLFMIWASTQHYADFAVQVRALTGQALDDPAFFAETRDAVVGTILRGVLARAAPDRPVVP
jgi:TetR/AcrR family transcriptional regulator